MKVWGFLVGRSRHGAGSARLRKGIKLAAVAVLLIFLTAFATAQTGLDRFAILTEFGPGLNPFPEGAAVKAMPDMHGSSSVQEFRCPASNLNNTHADAKGFFSHIPAPRNFWFKDYDVQNWQFIYDEWDNWKGDYGFDAVRVGYLSTHGGITSWGTFCAVMGDEFDNWGCYACSNEMNLGNQKLRYLFLSTCLSLKVTGGYNPIDIWDSAAKGLRMIFGYDTTSVDSPNYGEYFWEEYNKGKSFSTAFLDASWRISTNQRPSVVAIALTSAGAKDRVFNERQFYPQRATTNPYRWWWWRWYYKKSSRDLVTDLAVTPKVIYFERTPLSVDYVTEVADKFDMQLVLTEEIGSAEFGIYNFVDVDGQRRISFQKDGSYEVTLAEPNLESEATLSETDAIRIARDYIFGKGLAEEGEITFDAVRLDMHTGAAGGADEVVPAKVGETTVIFTMVIDGVPVLNNDAGKIAVSIDNDGTITRVVNSLREIELEGTEFRTTVAAPGEPEEAAVRDIKYYNDLVVSLHNAKVNPPGVQAAEAAIVQVKEGTPEFGYYIQGNEAIVVYRAEVEAIKGDFQKPEVYIVPVAE